MKDRIRFRPPAVALTPELRWVLAWAFADEPERCLAAEAIDLARAVELAGRLGLDARIGTRLAAAGCEPREAALERARAHAMATVLRARAAVEVVAAAAAALSIPVGLLKGVALDARRHTAAGSRAMTDVDALVAPADAPALAEAMRQRGFRSEGEAYGHQLPALLHPRLGSVELHLHLPGIRVGATRRFATLHDLRAAGWMEPWAEMPGEALLPSAPLIAGHLLAHALAQHGFRPTAYPPLRLYGDLLDLGLDDEGRVSGEGGCEPLAPAFSLISCSVPLREARAVARAGRLLASGEAARLGAGDDAATMLWHHLAGALDPRYRRRLALRELVHPAGDRGRLHASLRAALGALLLSRPQIDAIYGRPRRPWGYAARRAARPFDLAWRAGRALLS